MRAPHATSLAHIVQVKVLIVVAIVVKQETAARRHRKLPIVAQISPEHQQITGFMKIYETLLDHNPTTK